MEHFNSISKTTDFGRAYRQGKSYGNNLLVMFAYCRGRDQEGRVGISVSKKVGNSIIRHRLKRQIRECFRTHLSEWKDGYDIVVVARQGAKSQEYSKLLEALNSAGTCLGVYGRERD
ncbi:MAG: ribonuclease P protein component [Lachnospiraceae bacterium]|nr:ribonuclease P protein component [Candidatus Minthocola equi]